MKARLPACALVAGVLLALPAQADETPLVPDSDVPATRPAPAPAVRPGKAKGAWTGEYPIPKPPLPEGPVTAPPPAPELPPEAAPEPTEKSPAQSAKPPPG